MKPRFTMHCGLPGSNRSAHARAQLSEGAVLVTYRQVARQLTGATRAEVAAAIGNRIVGLLREGREVVLDDTNLIANRRRHLVNRIHSETDARCHAVFHCASYEQCRRALSRRGAPLNADSNWRLFREATPPTYDEGFDEIAYCKVRTLRPERVERLLEQLLDFDALFAALDLPELNELKTMPHDSPYHSEGIGEHIWHCYRAAWHAPEAERRDLVLLSVFHDIGKLAAREFSEKKGHSIYHGHDRNSAYLSACYGLEERLVRMVKYHQLPRDNRDLAQSYFSAEDWAVMAHFLEIDGSCRNF